MHYSTLKLPKKQACNSTYNNKLTQKIIFGSISPNVSGLRGTTVALKLPRFDVDNSVKNVKIVNILLTISQGYLLYLRLYFYLLNILLIL